MGKTTTYPAKINRPIFPNALKRERLFAFLEEDPPRKLIWISGPGGFGKTTLISNYITERNLPAVWYQFDTGDEDPATFYYYLTEACLKESPRKRKLIPTYKPDYASAIEVFSQKFFEAFYQRLDGPGVVVFDNLIEKPEKYFIITLLNALTRIPPDMRIVVVSRSDPPPELSILKAQNQMSHIEAEDLKFSFDEFKKVAALYEIDDFPVSILKRMFRETEGWAAGLVLVAQGYKRRKLNLEVGENLNLQEIYNFFAGEITERMNSGILDFLIRTSFMPNLTCHTAKLLTGYERSEEVLEFLTSNNLFTARADVKPATYRYHSLFREYLQNRASQSLETAEINNLRSRAARILRDTGQYEQAVELFAESSCWDDLAEMISQVAPEMWDHGRHHLLWEWITCLPEEILFSDHRLLYWIGNSLFPWSPKKSKDYFIQSIQIAREKGDAATSYLSWASAVDSIMFEFNDLAELDTLVSQFEHIQSQFPEYPSREIEGIAARGMLTALVFRQPENPTLDSWARCAMTISQESKVLSERIMVGVIEAMRQYYLGNMTEMTVVIETMIEPYNVGDLWISMRPLVKYLLGLKEWLLARNCIEYVEEGLRIANDTGVHIWDLLLLGQGATCALTRQDMDLAENYLGRMIGPMSSASRHDRSHYHYLSAWNCYLRNDVNLALKHAEMAYQLKLEVGLLHSIGTNRLALSEILWISGSRDEAMSLLAESRKTAEETNSGMLTFLCDITEAGFALDLGDTERTANLLKEAFTFGSLKNIFSFYWIRKRILSRFCSLAIRRSITISYAQDLIRKQNLVPADPDLEMGDWPWPIKLFTLGGFEIQVKEKAIQPTRKSQEKPLALLKTIISFGGKQVPTHQLTEALWPDSDGAVSQQALATTLHRLRKLIGVENAIILSNNEVTLNPEIVWTDIWAFERSVGRLAPALESGLYREDDVEKTASQIERILELYRGHFLYPDGSDSWSITPRERLRIKFIRVMMSYCSYLEGQKDYKKAVIWYQKALELENLSEEIYQGLILCYYRLGQNAEAISTYKRCKQVLADTFGIEPSSKTEEIRETVLGDNKKN